MSAVCSIHDHIPNHIHNPELTHDNTLHVVGVISNPVRYHSRYRLFREWYKQMEETPHVQVYAVEIAFGDRQFEVTDPNNPRHLQLRTSHELWHKENMINLAVRHLLPTNWRYVCWSDTDIFHTTPGWAQETLHQLQHYHVVQPWRDCLDLGPYGEVLKHFQSFCYVHRLGVPKQTHPSQPYMYAHSGFQWACTRLFWENIPGWGLIDWAILGSADHHMAWAMINEVDRSIHKRMGEDFKRKCHEWQGHAYRITQGHLGFVKTRIEHKFHGPKKKRYYRERWAILYENHFSPDHDLAYDRQGLLYLRDKPRLQHEIHDYFRARSEDEITVD